MKVHCQLWSTMKCIFPEKPLDHWKSRMDQWKVIASCFFWYLLLYKDPCQRYRSWSCNTSRMLFPHTHTHTHIRIDCQDRFFFKSAKKRRRHSAVSCVCVCDMRMCPSQQFAQFIQTAALYQRVCGGAPAAWCWAKSSSRLMWVTPAATGLRFIYLGKETGTQETQEDSDLTLKAANITENIKLLCYFSVFKWKLDDLSSHAFYPDTSLSVLCCPGFLC